MALFDFTLTDVVGVLIAGIAAGVAICVAFRETERFRKEMRERTYFEYTGRYQQIRTHLPAEIFSDSFPLIDLPKSDDTRRWLRAYFDLSTEEVKLHKRGMIQDDEWRNWTEGICENLSSPAAMWAWSNLHLDEYRTLKDFLDQCPSLPSDTGPSLDVGEIIASVELAIGRYATGPNLDSGAALSAIQTIVGLVKQELTKLLQVSVAGEVYTDWEIDATARTVVWLAWTTWMWTSKAERITPHDERAKTLGPIINRLLLDTARAGHALGTGGGRPENRHLRVRVAEQ